MAARCSGRMHVCKRTLHEIMKHKIKTYNHNKTTCKKMDPANQAEYRV